MVQSFLLPHLSYKSWKPLDCSRPTPVLLHIIRGDAQVNARRQCEGCDDDDYDCSHYTPDKTVTLSPTHTIVLEDGKLWRRCQMIIQKNWMFITEFDPYLQIVSLLPSYHQHLRYYPFNLIMVLPLSSSASSWPTKHVCNPHATQSMPLQI